MTPLPDAPALLTLARQAAELFLDDVTDLQLLRHGDNAVFAVRASGQRFALRLHSAGRLDPGALGTELAWLDHLSRVAGLPVPSPVPAHVGGRLARVADLWCSLLTWLDGEPLPEGEEFSAVQAAQAGALIARLHLEGERAADLGLTDRPTFDAERFLRSWHSLDGALAGHVGGARREALGRELRARLTDLGPLEHLPGGWGLLHGDLHPGNFVQRADGLGLLDFDRCGWGPLLLDLADLSLALDQPERAACLNAYRALRPLPADVDAPLRTLRLWSAVENLAFLAPRPGELPYVLDAFGRMEEVLAQR